MSLIEYALHFLGKPYIWAGSGSIGFDCSGLIVEVFQAFGILPQGDWCAHDLHAYLRKNGWSETDNPCEGCLLFFGAPKKYTHVSLMVNDWQFIEAGGGGMESTTAENSRGLVRLRPLSWKRHTLALRPPITVGKA